MTNDGRIRRLVFERFGVLIGFQSPTAMGRLPNGAGQQTNWGQFEQWLGLGKLDAYRLEKVPRRRSDAHLEKFKLDSEAFALISEMLESLKEQHLEKRATAVEEKRQELKEVKRRGREAKALATEKTRQAYLKLPKATFEDVVIEAVDTGEIGVAVRTKVEAILKGMADEIAVEDLAKEFLRLLESQVRALHTAEKRLNNENPRGADSDGSN